LAQINKVCLTKEKNIFKGRGSIRKKMEKKEESKRKQKCLFLTEG
jgi:hypothetical protein